MFISCSAKKKVCFDDFFILSIIILILTRSSAPVWVGPCAMEQLKEKRTYHQPCKKTFSMTIQACQYFNYSVNHSFPFHYFVFQCSIPFRCFRWLNDSMLMLATVEKKKDSDFFYRHSGVVIYSKWIESLCIGMCFSRLVYMGRIFEPKDESEWRLTCRMLDLTYQQTELDFCANPLAKVIKFFRDFLPTVHLWGGLLFVGTVSHFLERIIITWLHFYKTSKKVKKHD